MHGNVFVNRYLPLLIVAFVTGIFNPLFAAAKQIQLAVQGYTGASALTDFQALVKLSEGQYGFSYADYQAGDGSDIWFTDSSGNLIPHEIDSWNAFGDSFIWVKIPTVLPSTDANFPTAITMHWGEARTAAQTCAASDTWSNFAGVWHMNGTVIEGVAQNEPDATGHGLDGVPTVNYGTGNLAAMVSGTGIVGSGRVNQSAQGYVQGLKVPDYSPHISDASKFTISGWWSATALPTYARFFSTEGVNNFWSADCYSKLGYAMLNGVYSNGNPNNGGSNSGNIAVDSFKSPNWVYLTFVWDGTTFTAYSNGKQKKQNASMVAQTAISTGFMIGGNSAAKSIRSAWVGSYDEIRMFNGVQSADRAAADYATMNMPTTFLTRNVLIATATWTGSSETDATDATDPTNWECRDENDVVWPDMLPAAKTDVTISGTDIKANFTSALAVKSVTIGNVSLGANCDWKGLDSALFTSGTTIDLKGFKLATSGLGNGATFTNTAEGTPADLDVTFASAAENSTTAISGNIRFVKRGSGQFTSAKAQTYTGGTLVAQGDAVQTLGTKDEALDETYTLFGTGTVTVNSGANFKVQSKRAYQNEVVLAGGGIVCGLPGTTNGLSRLTANSTVRWTTSGTSSFFVGKSTNDVIELNRHTLTAHIDVAGYLQLISSFGKTSGTIHTSGGYLCVPPNYTVYATNVSFKVNSKMNIPNAKLYVRDYEAMAVTDRNYGYGEMFVYGTFKPNAVKDGKEYFYGCTMMNGSTIDLSEKTGPWAVKSSMWAQCQVTFKDNSTVYVKVGSRELDKNTAVISWNSNTIPKNLDTLRFICADGENAGKEFAKRSTGIYPFRTWGLVITIH